jgi:O-antigen chain-terminating methyltransferase
MPRLKRLEHNLKRLLGVGRKESRAKIAIRRLDAIDHRLDQVEEELREFHQNLNDTTHSVREAAQAEHMILARLFGDLTRRLDRLIDGSEKSATIHSTKKETENTPTFGAEGFEGFKNSFYHRLENRYRGSLDDITKRLQVYLPDVEAAYIRTGEKPVADLGCGRGEWLGILHAAGISSFGIDLNRIQIDEAREQNLDVREGDAIAMLSEMDNESLSVITAHHLIEHVPFDTVAWMTREAMRVLAPGGILLYETPHVGNVLVGATTFHTDPTHIKPIPEQVLKILFETAGYHPVESRFLNPHERLDEFIDRPGFDPELAHLLFGPQDLAVIGQKPRETA